ncbi:C1 family peptidase [Streptomyces tremellae]|uniref:Peptidase C1A papain C-terminal domain-containing protein n=1 Tax=Streptomyces tremellae TaxID=1124239 RepID=A0ABP7EH99_9ACTN
MPIVPAFRRFTESPDAPYRLGRHQVHDALPPRLAAVVDHTEPIKTVEHEEFVPPFDQGRIGSCTANAALGTLVTAPYGHAGVAYTEDDAVELYELETKLDDSQIPGNYPPDDTGSTGPWSMQALEKRGLIHSFRHARDLATALRMLNTGPISIGVTWYNAMFTPDATNAIHADPSSGIGGGHQVCIVGNDVENKRIRIRNSWGTSWGDNGHAWLSWADFGALLRDGGDVVQPILNGASA